MYAITGITGRVGSAAAKYLSEAGKPVRVVARNPEKVREWSERGTEVAIADFTDARALEAAFAGMEGVYVMLPPYFAPQPDFPEARAISAALREALEKTRPEKVVALSSIGSQHDHGLGLITQTHILEQALGDLPVPVAFIRATSFLENILWDIEPVLATGILPSFLQPLDRPFTRIATDDIGRTAAELLQQEWTGKRVIELEGPRAYSQNDIAAVFAALLHKPVQAVAVPRDEWVERFTARGGTAETVAANLEMLDGFNSGWIDFEGGHAEHKAGIVTLEEVLAPALSQ